MNCTIKGFVGHKYQQGTLDNGICEPPAKLICVEALVLNAQFVIGWFLHEFFFGELPVKHSKPNDRESGEKDVIHLIQNNIIE